MKWKKIIYSSLLTAALSTGYSIETEAQTVTVQPGDSLYFIAQRHHASITEIKETNQLEDNIIYPGQTLIIPDKSYTYTVESGDSLFLIAKRFGTSINHIMESNELTSSVLYPGQIIQIPSNRDLAENDYVVQSGDSLFLIAQQFNTSLQILINENNLSDTTIYPGQVLEIPKLSDTRSNEASNEKSNQESSDINRQGPWVEYKTYTVQQGETGWTIALKFGIPFQEFLEMNDLSTNSVLMPGDKVQIAVHHIPVQDTISNQFGEKLDWWTEAQYVWPIGEDAIVQDLYTGKQWKMRRTIGASHADVEPVTSSDTSIMKEVWGGEWSWTSRPVLIYVNGHRVAASASAMPHSIEYIKDNNFPGHSDIHFLNSRRHKDNQVDAKHQKNVRIAAGEVER